MIEKHTIEVRPDGDGLYTIYLDGEPAEGFKHKPQVLAEFLAAWLAESFRECERLIAKRN